MVAPATGEPTLPLNFQPGPGTTIDHAPVEETDAAIWLYPLIVSCPKAGTPNAVMTPITATLLPNFTLCPQHPKTTAVKQIACIQRYQIKVLVCGKYLPKNNTDEPVRVGSSLYALQLPAAFAEQRPSLQSHAREDAVWANHQLL